jgi:hypothetical protein
VWSLAPDSPPPHIIQKWKFATWQAVAEWHEQMQFKTDSDILGQVIQDGLKHNEYVQHEIDVMDVTGQIYTKAILAIEGNEE